LSHDLAVGANALCQQGGGERIAGTVQFAETQAPGCISGKLLAVGLICNRQAVWVRRRLFSQ